MAIQGCLQTVNKSGVDPAGMRPLQLTVDIEIDDVETSVNVAGLVAL